MAVGWWRGLEPDAERALRLGGETLGTAFGYRAP